MPQMPMYPGMPNSPQTELANAINDTQTTIEVLDGSVLPDAPNICTILGGELSETILYTSKSGNTLSGITRGLRGQARSWSQGQKVARNFSSYDWDSVRHNIEDHETRLTEAENNIEDLAGAGRTTETVKGNADALAAHTIDYASHVSYAVASGSANTYSVTLNPAPAGYVEGMALAVKINVANTGASTINVNGLGAKSIKKANGNDVASGNLKAGSIYTLRYNGTNFILQGEGGEYGNATPADVRMGKTFGTENGVVEGTMPNITLNGKTTYITTENGEIIIPAGYSDGTGKVKATYQAGKPFLTGSQSMQYQEVITVNLPFTARLFYVERVGTPSFFTYLLRSNSGSDIKGEDPGIILTRLSDTQFRIVCIYEGPRMTYTWTAISM